MIAGSGQPSELWHPASTRRSRSVRWTLARVEGRRLVTHPIFLLGLAVQTAQIMATAPGVQLLPGVLFAVDVGAACTLLVTFLAVSREHRDHARDTYLALPAPPRLRTAAMLLSLGWVGLTGAAVVVALILAGRGPQTASGLDLALEVLLAAQYYVLAGALGVLLGTWTRHIPAAVLMALVLFVTPLMISPSLTVEPLGPGNLMSALLSPEAWGIRTLFAAAGLTAIAAAGALARHDRNPRDAALAIAGLGAIAGLTAAAVATAFALVVLLWPRSPDLAPGTVLPEDR